MPLSPKRNFRIDASRVLDKAAKETEWSLPTVKRLDEQAGERSVITSEGLRRRRVI
jgi:hypothetical protein